jgi:hypothetical protein
MKEERLEELLNELAERVVEPVRPGLAEDMKHQIPSTLGPHRGGMETINIIVHLRINRLTAAASILIAMILLANLFGGQDASGAGILDDGRILARYFLGTNVGQSHLSALRSRYEHLVQKGEEAIFHADKTAVGQSNEVLLYWKLPDEKYRVVFGDFCEMTVSADVLIKLQAYMLQNRTK